MKDTLSFFRGKRERERERVLISFGSNLRFSFLSSRGRGRRVLGFRWRKCLSLGCDPTTSWIHEIARLAASTIAGRTINVPGYSAIICYRLSSSPIELRPYYYRTGAFLTLDYFCQGQECSPVINDAPTLVPSSRSPSERIIRLKNRGTVLYSSCSFGNDRRFLFPSSVENAKWNE